jgi:hypothetical protein
VRIARSVRAGVARSPSLKTTLERSVDTETERGLVASYFFTVPPVGHWSRYDCAYAPRDPCLFRGRRVRIADVMHTLADEGFDVGLHGSFRSAVEPGTLASERDALQRATGLPVTTTRQHFLHWDVRRTPRAQEEAGFRVDTTLGFNRVVGFRAGTSFPFHQFDAEGSGRLGLLEVPLVIQDVALFREQGPRLELERACSVARELIDAVEAVGGVVTLLFHPDRFVEPDWLALYEWCLDYALERRAWVTSLAHVDDWWRRRESQLLDA